MQMFWFVATRRILPNRLSSLLAIVLSLSLVGSLTLPTSVNADSKAQPTLPSITLDFNGIELTTEVAQHSAQRYMGLSFRESMPTNAGMLFVYPNEQMLTFTMRNTLIPLTIAYLSKDMVINEFHEMPVGPNQLFPSKKPAQFALEVNRGWFEKNGIAVGDRVTVR